jgi:hypothetical protein
MAPGYIDQAALNNTDCLVEELAGIPKLPHLSKINLRLVELPMLQPLGAVLALAF